MPISSMVLEELTEQLNSCSDMVFEQLVQNFCRLDDETEVEEDFVAIMLNDRFLNGFYGAIRNLFI